MSGSTLFAGRYALVDELGRGAFGIVYRAWDIREQRYVAAKMLQQSRAHNLLRFVREGATRIEHPHVVAPSGWAAADDRVLIAMDLVGGGTLASLVGDYGPLPPRYVLTLVDQVLAGLEAVHAQRIVHRDIKPGNLLLEATGLKQPHVRIGDFGLAHQAGHIRITHVDQIIGTPGYIAPEQYDGAEPDPQFDLFAVGVVALHLLRGEDLDVPALVQAFDDDGVLPAAPEEVPDPWWQVLARLLHPDPRQRFASAARAREALAAITPRLPEPDSDSAIEVFDQLPPLPDGFGPTGPTGPIATEPARPSVSTPKPTAHTVQLRRPAPEAITPPSEPEPAPAPASAFTPQPTAHTMQLRRRAPAPIASLPNPVPAPAHPPTAATTAPLAPDAGEEPRPVTVPSGTGMLAVLGLLLIGLGIWAWLA
ncbi:serine/threonine-protein kinase [Streptomyces sp. NPDC046853]|uniref:serine/threonine-protein kinase n=1 Tax=Streptomyces sp. NPDC046853 TaxID=3154920 RepID=UPI003405847C